LGCSRRPLTLRDHGNSSGPQVAVSADDFDSRHVDEAMHRAFERLLPGLCAALTRAELEEARLGADRLLAALGRQAEAEPNVDPNEVIYRQLYSRVVRAYAEVRDALRFLRRKQGDAERIAPSIFPRPKGR
jgi:hypothetical protein